MMRDLYADNYAERRQEALLRSEGRCENNKDGQRCSHRLGTFRISHSHNAYFEQLLIHHPNSDPGNPDAVMIAVCASCHMKLHRKPGTDGKVPARKQGYRVVSITHLLTRLETARFFARSGEAGRMQWRIGPFEAEAADPIDAVAMALHWLCAEVGDLRRELEQQRTACHQHRLQEVQP